MKYKYKATFVFFPKKNIMQNMYVCMPDVLPDLV